MSNQNFKVLSEQEHLLKRPSMYIGSTSTEDVSGIIDGTFRTISVVPGLLKITNEILDNCVDEFIRTDGKHANKIEVTINQTVMGPEITIRDNGRGIPVTKQDGEYIPVLAWTRARAGSNFGNDADRTTAGMNGVGSFCTNVFSTSFTGVTCDGDRKLTLRCEDNATSQKVTVRKIKTKDTFTEVKFIPDMSRFGDGKCMRLTDDHILAIRDRIQNLAICYPKIQFKFNGKVVSFKNLNQIASMYATDYVAASSDSQTLVICNSGDDQEFRCLSYVNGLNIASGGTHIEFIVNSLINELRPMIKRKHKIDVKPANIRQHLMLVSYASGFKNLKFNSQTKERITNSNSEVSEFFGEFDFAKLAKTMMTKDALIQPIIQAMLAKKELADRLALARAQKKQAKLRVADHIAATSKNPKNKMLFITEGRSAIGSLLRVRDPAIHGGYPLRGKVMNTRGMKPAEIVKNKELSELMSILGLTYGDKKPSLNYDKIVMMTDADTDGSAIACLLVNFFSEWEQVLKNHLYRLETPRYIARNGKKVKYFYNKAEFDSANLGSGWKVKYIKGLGSLTEEDYGNVINDPKLTKIVMKDKDDINYLDMAFGDDAGLRKEWLAC